MKERKVYIDIAKAIAILLVVSGHIIYFCIGQEDLDFSRRFILQELLSYIEMPLFVICSALVSKSKIDDTFVLKNELEKKFRTLIVPFLLFGFIYALFSGSTIHHFLYNTMKLGYWYLLLLFELHLINYLSLYINRLFEKCRRPFLSDCLFMVVVYLLITFVYRGTDPEAISWKNMLGLLKLKQYYLMFFFIIFLKRYNLVDRIFFNRNLFTVALIISVIILICNSLDVHFYGRSYIMPWTLTIVVLYAIRQIADNKCFMGGGTKLLICIGQSSMDIYLIHFFFINSMNLSFLMPIMNRVTDLVGSSVIVFPIAILVTCFSMITGKIIRKSEILNKLIFYK